MQGKAEYTQQLCNPLDRCVAEPWLTNPT